MGKLLKKEAAIVAVISFVKVVLSAFVFHSDGRFCFMLEKVCCMLVCAWIIAVAYVTARLTLFLISLGRQLREGTEPILS